MASEPLSTRYIASLDFYCGPVILSRDLASRDAASSIYMRETGDINNWALYKMNGSRKDLRQSRLPSNMELSSDFFTKLTVFSRCVLNITIP